MSPKTNTVGTWVTSIAGTVIGIWALLQDNGLIDGKSARQEVRTVLSALKSSIEDAEANEKRMLDRIHSLEREVSFVQGRLSVPSVHGKQAAGALMHMMGGVPLSTQQRHRPDIPELAPMKSKN
jgi:hypothetical protein